MDRQQTHEEFDAGTGTSQTPVNPTGFATFSVTAIPESCCISAANSNQLRSEPKAAKRRGDKTGPAPGKLPNRVIVMLGKQSCDLLIVSFNRFGHGGICVTSA
jgi:hypothetical protein